MRKKIEMSTEKICIAKQKEEQARKVYLLSIFFLVLQSFIYLKIILIESLPLCFLFFIFNTQKNF